MINESGIQPVEYKVLVLPEAVESKTTGGLFLPETVKEKEEIAQVRGTLIAIGGSAFCDWNGQIPHIGDCVYVAKYAGIYGVKGKDGKEYRLMNDKDIAAVFTEE